MPAVALKAIEPEASCKGSTLTPLAFPASLTRYRCPGSSRWFVSGVTCQSPVPPAEAYWTDQPESETAVAPRLNSSM